MSAGLVDEGGGARAPGVSVVIPTYNRSALLVRAVDSVLRQDWPQDDVEIIVVDDGSTDDTREVVQRRYGGRVRYLPKDNGGINSAYEFGFRQARGWIVAQLDSDDYWYPDKLSSCMPLFEQAEDVVAVLHDLDVIDEASGERRGTWWGRSRGEITSRPMDGLAHYMAGRPIKAISSACLWRRSALMKVLPFPPALWGFADAYLIRHVIFYGRICAANRSLGAYVIHQANDYGGGKHAVDAARVERHVRDATAMIDAFNARCAEHGLSVSARRLAIQRHSLTEAHLARHLLDGRLAALRWLMRNEFGVGARSQCQFVADLLLPARVASFFRNRLLNRLGGMD